MLVPVSDADLELLDKLVEELEENDDVQDVYTNAE
jgi:transcriptional/translational regulatory protein YebC/TACO1